MSKLAPDGNFLDEEPAGNVHGSNFSLTGAATDVSAAPLWMAFRDHYTRAKQRRQPSESVELECQLAPCL
jgi:hypothetical protein